MNKNFEIWPIPPRGATKYIESGNPWARGSLDHVKHQLNYLLERSLYDSATPRAYIVKQAGAPKTPNWS